MKARKRYIFSCYIGGTLDGPNAGSKNAEGLNHVALGSCGRKRTGRSYLAADHHAHRGGRCCLRLQPWFGCRGSRVVASAMEAIRSFCSQVVTDLVVGGELHDATKNGDLAAVKARLRSQAKSIPRP